jgi:hypothetical protein
MDGLTGRGKNEKMDGQTKGDRCTDRETNGCTDQWTCVLTDQLVDGQVDGQTDGWIDKGRQMYRQRDKWMC